MLGIGLAVVAPVLLPAGDGFLGARDWSGGTAGGGSAVRLDNPLVDVKRDLVRGQDTALVEVRTADPDPSYLRLAVLDEFDGITWRPAERDLPIENRAAGDVPTAERSGASAPGQEFEWNVRVLETFETAWLPTPFPYSAVDVDGDWRFDTDTMDLTSPGGRLDGAGVEYEVTGVELTPDQWTLASAPPAPAAIRSEYTDLPSSLPTEFAELAEKVSAGAASAFERAVMLQDWFRDDGGFRYSLERAEGNGIEQLQLFLGSGPGSRVGYCEQFASAMAMMARSLQIPARVAVGFLTPEKVGDLYVYSAHDLHAWPELYFEGVGWLRFEPTPARRARDVPEYTNGALPASQPVPTPSERASVAPPPQTRAEESLNPGGEPADETAPPTWVSWSGWMAGALAVIALLLTPRLMRSQLQKRRLQITGASPAEDAWSEVRATALDLRHGWDDGVTLRRRARDMVPSVGAADNGDAVRALESLVLLLERSRYSRDGANTAGSAEAPRLARIVIEAMTATASPRRRRQASWLPSSLWQGSGAFHHSAMTDYGTADGDALLTTKHTEGISV